MWRSDTVDVTSLKNVLHDKIHMGLYAANLTLPCNQLNLSK